MLRAQPGAVDITTGDGRTPLLVLALCEDAADRMATLEVLLTHPNPNPNLTLTLTQTPILTPSP